MERCNLGLAAINYYKISDLQKEIVWIREDQMERFDFHCWTALPLAVAEVGLHVARSIEGVAT
jgi:hypothetical protein